MVLELLARGFDHETVAARVGVTPGQVSPVAAHVKMGTYEKHRVSDTVIEFTPPAGREHVHELIEQIGAANRQTFQDNGLSLDWQAMLESGGHVFVIQLKGLEHSLERAATEFLLWNLIGFIESGGPGSRRCFVILDEAHKLALVPGSPAEKLLREGRKFGLGLILASQQPEDFSSVAFSNTATKMVFPVGDDKSVVSRRLARKVVNSHSLAKISELITRLPRGWAYFISENIGRVVRIHSFEERMARWHQRFAL